MKSNRDVELFLDKKGTPTIDYPHVHVVHKSKTVDIVDSKPKGNHVWKKILNSPSGSEVDKATAEARSKL